MGFRISTRDALRGVGVSETKGTVRFSKCSIRRNDQDSFDGIEGFRASKEHLNSHRWA
ncbi:hypothetical protein M422DRAFT_28880 [Sphaerobolus stellatus SS14]|uniref:Uncharacterized protein n=1 Tax=Sphaerobolus stellatus (strain SS14) TaxID=990650 RepID=A0A0C9TYX2_SPHS4|nr:hypothetical protein M422DRAFT_37962 [Sphaerobolus stellatus SS14]KIJ47215.1 hypothetical protein M422DRAFT_28880 [Sphaerobolus stellatus SS14]